MPETDPELSVLQAIRLAGVADREGIEDRALLRDTVIDLVLGEAKAARLIEWFAFGDSAGWTITEAGARRVAALLRDEVSANQAATVLNETLDSFEPLNAAFVALISGWQLRTTTELTSGSHRVDELLTSLTSLGSELREQLTGLTHALPRFGRYPAQFSNALARAHQEGLSWVTGVGRLSCHVAWAELHQDLLSSAGRDSLDGLPGR